MDDTNKNNGDGGEPFGIRSDLEEGNEVKADNVTNDAGLSEKNCDGEDPPKTNIEEGTSKPRRRRAKQISAPTGLFEVPWAESLLGAGVNRARVNEDHEGPVEHKTRPRRIKQLSEPTSLFATPGIERSEWKPIHHAIRAKEMKETQFNFRIPTQAAAEVHIEEKHGTNSWNYRVVRFLHSKPVTHAMMTLLVLDVIVLFIEIFLLALYPPCIIVERDAVSCFPRGWNSSATEISTALENLNRLLAGGGYGEICPDGLEPNFDYPAGCDDSKWDTVHKAEQVLFAVTMTILSSFMLELNIEMIALGPKVFFRQVFFFMDYFVIAISLALEAFFHSINKDNLQSLVGLLVLIRIWRFIRIGHGIVAVTAEMSDSKYEALLAHVEHLEEVICQNKIETPVLLRDASEPERAVTHVLDQVKKEHRLHILHKKSMQNLQSSDDEDKNSSVGKRKSR
ncbi:hypothetical protein IV203_025322 [Nitzschia inconspicua]|uniref:Ion transport domain-containing protein n=1 Tax=Nitzschia inconspicua TaxID=303405 RepID=A0A9K3LI27_9STRA|nr:hypothetical protein IV203_024674 [Nitzschia inconspicua]KAG7362438.1 hypothetical protein IV203_025322 [Nitzschia inconspicua]